MDNTTLGRLCEWSNLILDPEETKILLEDIQHLLDKFSLLESLPEASVTAKDRRVYFRPDPSEDVSEEELDILLENLEAPAGDFFNQSYGS